MNKKNLLFSCILSGILVCGLSTTALGLNYTVQAGDNLYNIAKKYDCTVKDLMTWNQLSSSLIHPQQILKVSEEYTVQPGDTLTFIAKKIGVTVSQLEEFNRLKTTLLHPGQVLAIPAASKKQQANAYNLSENDINLIARVVYGESRGEPYEGQVAVAAVILNRLESNQFPNSVYDIVYAPRQFSVVNDKQIDLKPNDKAYKAVKDAMAGTDPTNNALYFWNPKTAVKSKFLSSRDIQVQIGNHVFAR